MTTETNVETTQEVAAKTAKTAKVKTAKVAKVNRYTVLDGEIRSLAAAKKVAKAELTKACAAALAVYRAYVKDTYRPARKAAFAKFAEAKVVGKKAKVVKAEKPAKMKAAAAKKPATKKPVAKKPAKQVVVATPVETAPQA